MMKTVSGIFGVAILMAALGGSVTYATPRVSGVDSGAPLFTEVAAKMSKSEAVQAKVLEAKINAAAKSLQDNVDFKAAVEKKDGTKVEALLRKTSGVRDTPMKITFGDSGGGEAGKIRWELTISCCPLGIRFHLL